MINDPAIVEATLEKLESIAYGLEACHRDGSCHGWSARILDCIDCLRGNEKPKTKAVAETDCSCHSDSSRPQEGGE